ncbi:hypothetical protein J5491_02610 [Candidatus Saccharibacteria bacterium]|nr:hypothetical protein [Candidatus Saccharibacteria bacterium]
MTETLSGSNTESVENGVQNEASLDNQWKILQDISSPKEAQDLTATSEQSPTMDPEQFVRKEAAEAIKKAWADYQFPDSAEQYSDPSKDETEEQWKTFYKNMDEDFPSDSDDTPEDIPEDKTNNSPDDKTDVSFDPDTEELINLDRAKDALDGEKLDTLEIEKLEDMDKKATEVEDQIIEKSNERIEEIDAMLEELAGSSALVAVEANTSYDRDVRATQLAEEEFGIQTKNAKFFKRLWMNYFEKYYKTKYKREFLTEGRKLNRDGEQISLDTIMERNIKGGIGRVVRSVTENEMDYIHQAFGESRTEADKEKTEAIRNAIMKYAEARGDAADEKQFTAMLKEEMAKLKQEGNFDNPDYMNNYFEVAENAIKVKELMRGKVSMDKVLEKFAVYNADVRDSERSKVSRGKLDQLIDKWEKSSLSRFISPETVAIATSVVSLFAKSGANRAARLLIPVGGVLVSSALAGARERRRVTNEREVMMRNMEKGRKYEDNPDEAESRFAKKRAKLEEKIAGTTYGLESTSELIANINSAIESGDEEKIMRAYTAARVRVDFSDSEEKGLISSSSEFNEGDERLALDIALAEAKRRVVKPENQATLAEMRKTLLSKITKDVDKGDEEFKRVRLLQTLKASGRAALFSGVGFFLSQEGAALVSENKIGALEKLGVFKTQNQANAKETMIASLIKSRSPGAIKGISADRVDEMESLRRSGYRGTKVSDEVITTRKTYIDGDPATSPHAAKVFVREWANNGTEAYDGNELRVSGDGAYTMTTAMHGDSIAPISGRTLNFENLVQENRIKGFVTINGVRFEAQGIPAANGQITFIQNGMITTTSGDIIQAVDSAGNKLYEYFEIGATFGKDASTGLTEFVPMATSVGNLSGGPFTGMFQESVEEVITKPAIYNFELPTGGTIYDGVVLPAMSARVGIGNGTAAEKTPDQGGEPTQPTPPATEGESGDGGPTPPATEGESGDGEPTQPTPPATEQPNPDADQPTPPQDDGQAGGEQAGNSGKNDQADEEAEKIRKARRDYYTNLLNNDFSFIGEDAVKVLLEKPGSDPNPDERFSRVWLNLTPTQREAVETAVKTVDGLDIPEGKEFREWVKRTLTEGTMADTPSQQEGE